MSSLTFGFFKTSQLVLLVCFLGALAIALLAARRKNVKVADTSLQIFFVSLVAARIVFVAMWFDQYWKAPLSILDIRDGGFNVFAGIIAGCALVAWQTWRQPTLRAPLGAATLVFLLAWTYAAPSVESAAGNITVPEPAVTTFSGKTASLRELAQGKPMVVNLWASWCPPCRREMPLLVDAQKTNSDIAFVFINEDSNLEDALFFANQMKMPIDRIVADPRNDMMRMFRTGALPTTLYFSREGKLVSTHVGGLSGATLANELRALRN
ncbi:MAG TPA: TlpA disulfide reductase family protein [Oxalicibacterium sp.]|nr:TlpA disulfide reductase family protein [Oxalicibacterium sp.]